MKINIERINDHKIIFHYFFENKVFSHTIECTEDTIPTDDSLYRLALFSRPANSSKYIVNNVVVSVQVNNVFQVFMNASIQVEISDELFEKELVLQNIPKNSYLCFSGGFDSLASKALLPDYIKLLSIKFGGVFERESDFFKNYNDNIVSWELRGKRIEQTERFIETVDWRFLLAPALLYRKYDEPLGILTGTIMEASLYWFSSSKRPEFHQYAENYGPYVALINPVSSLTEYSTTLIANQFLGPEKIKLSLKSLAHPDSIKFYRKQILLAIVNEDKLPKPNKLLKKHRFGSSFADDFLSIYFAWKCGRAWTLANYVDRLPNSIDEIDMSYVEKANQNNLDTLDSGFRSEIILKLKHYGIDLYNDEDFLELEKTKTILLAKDNFSDTNKRSIFNRICFWKN